MAMFCGECPAAECIMKTFETEDDRVLAVHVSQYLSGKFVKAVRGTTGLTPERIEELRQKEIRSWTSNQGTEEVEILTEHPELVTAVYECERRVTILGECAIHST